MVALDGQPQEGFAGPGKAYLWLVDHGFDMERLGVELLVVRDDGARPLVNCRGQRTFMQEVRA